MKRVLVTGGTGHLGKCVVACLNESSYEVSILTSRENISSGNNVSIFKGDLSKNAGLIEATAGADMIIHCASNPEMLKRWILTALKIY